MRLETPSPLVSIYTSYRVGGAALELQKDVEPCPCPFPGHGPGPGHGRSQPIRPPIAYHISQGDGYRVCSTDCTVPHAAMHGFRLHPKMRIPPLCALHTLPPGTRAHAAYCAHSTGCTLQTRPQTTRAPRTVTIPHKAHCSQLTEKMSLPKNFHDRAEGSKGFPT
jgi:hypothetical protein